MGKSIIFIIIQLLSLLPMTGLAGDNTSYSQLVRKADSMTSGKVMEMADKYADKGKQGEALVLYAVVYGRFTDSIDDEGKNLCSLAHLNAGKLYYDRGDYVEALNEFVNGVKLSEQCVKPRYAAQMYKHIGNVYCMFLDWEKGLDYYKKAYNFAKKYSDKKTCHDILVNMTGMYTFLGDMSNAMKYYKLSEQTKDSTDPEDIYMSGYTLSLIQIQGGDADAGITRLKMLAGYAVEKRLEPKYQCFAYQEIYTAYEILQIPDSALKYMELCDVTARRYNLQHTFTTTLKRLSEFYNNKGDVVMSNKYKSRYLDIMDSIYDMRRFDAVRNSLFTYEVGKTTREISSLKEREEQRLQTIRLQRTVMTAVAIAAVVTAVLLIIVWRQKRRLRRSYADLYSVNRNFVDLQERLTARLRSANEALQERDNVISCLKDELGRTATAPVELPSEMPKYLSSNLGEQQRLELAERIQDVMENTNVFCNCDFSLDTLAELVGSNKKYVSQVINDTFGKSFNNYINPYRIHLAQCRFADTEHYGNLTMKAVAESVGFKSYSSFVSVFRKVTGISPSLYRDMALRDKA